MNSPSQNINVALAPFNIQPGETKKNIATITSIIESLPAETNLIVLPELCLTGFTANGTLLQSWAEPLESNTINTLKTLSLNNDIAIFGTYLAIDNKSRLFNRGFAILPSGDTFFYNKRHLFSAGAESQLLTPGCNPSPVINYMTWNFKLSICYDLRFPVWNRNVNLEYDALIVPANWPSVRQYAWEQLIKARAIENQAYVLACNREGSDEYGDYLRGNSFVADDFGKIISKHIDNNSLVFATLNASQLVRNRNHFAPYLDADSFTIVP